MHRCWAFGVSRQLHVPRIAAEAPQTHVRSSEMCFRYLFCHSGHLCLSRGARCPRYVPKTHVRLAKMCLRHKTQTSGVPRQTRCPQWQQRHESSLSTSLFPAAVPMGRGPAIHRRNDQAHCCPSSRYRRRTHMNAYYDDCLIPGMHVTEVAGGLVHPYTV